eukprot:354861-Chlamydomonas_euryale.AAC.14
MQGCRSFRARLTRHLGHRVALQDVNREPGAEDMFKKIGEAYEVGRFGIECMFMGIAFVWYGDVAGLASSVPKTQFNWPTMRASRWRTPAGAFG